jgi:hypothetical protein
MSAATHAGTEVPHPARLALLACGGALLVLGALGGLWRLGWEPPLPGTEPATFHGALMIAGFFGTLVGLERAVAAGRRLAYLAPLLTGCGGLATAFGAPHLISASLLLAGSTVLAAVAFGAWRREPAAHQRLLLTGACCGVAGNALWLAGLPASEAVAAWAGFLVLTIAGERLEVSHLRLPSAAALKLLAAAAALYVAGAAILPLHWQTGTLLVGAALIGLSLWLFVHDIAGRNLRHHGQVRYTAICVVAGYAWLALGGLLLPFAAQGGLRYDAALHAVFLGFVFAMAFGHAPVVFPAVVRAAIPYSPLFYGHLALLNATLVLRLAGDLFARDTWRAWGGAGNAAALALFAFVMIGSVLRGRRMAAGIA